MSISGERPQGSGTDEILRLLADPASFQEKLKQFQESEASAKAAVALVGPAEEILALRSEAEKIRESAKVALDGANQRASEIIQTAEATAAVLRNEAQVSIVAATEASQKMKSEASELLAAATKQKEDSERAAALSEEQLKKKFDDLMVMESAAQESIKSAEAETDAAKALSEKLRSVIGGINDLVAGVL
jgi:ribosomal 50S subunit-recycling heat shock protein